MTLTLTLGVRLFVLWIVTQGVTQGDKTAMRHVAALQDALGLDEVMSPRGYTPDEAGQSRPHTTERANWQWLKDKLDEIFKGGRCPTQYARYALELDDALNAALAEKQAAPAA